MGFERLHLLIIIGTIGLIIFTVELIRREKLKEEYALLWLVLWTIFLIISVNPRIVNAIGSILGVKVASNALFTLGFLFVIAILLSLSIIISDLSKKNRILTQHLSILEMEKEKLKNALNKLTNT